VGVSGDESLQGVLAGRGVFDHIPAHAIDLGPVRLRERVHQRVGHALVRDLELQELHAEFPGVLSQALRLRGVGPRRFDSLSIRLLESFFFFAPLIRACHAPLLGKCGDELSGRVAPFRSGWG